MPNFPLSDIRPGMSVCDRDSERIGTITRVHQLGRVVGVPPVEEGYVQVDPSLRDLGKELYIPLDVIGECSGDTCFLNLSSDEIKGKGWNRKPANI